MKRILVPRLCLGTHCPRGSASRREYCRRMYGRQSLGTKGGEWRCSALLVRICLRWFDVLRISGRRLIDGLLLLRADVQSGEDVRSLEEMSTFPGGLSGY